MTGIEWTDQTWNPATGCTKVSAGCANCYAETMAKRLQANGTKKYANGFRYTEHKDAIGLPLKWKRPRRVFVNSMSDFFHEDASYAFQKECVEVMARCPQHQFQVLTKRPEAATQLVGRLFGEGREWPDNAWLGVSVEDASQVRRLTVLGALGEAVKVKFVSFEPLLGPIPDSAFDDCCFQWAIVGGESGPGHRPIKAEWVRSLRDSCVSRNVAFFFKQWGGARPKSGGRELDGRTWDEYPGQAAPGQTLLEVLA